MSEVKIFMTGSAAVGKSTTTLRFIFEKYLEEYDPTIEDTFRKNITIKGKSKVFDILDPGGREGKKKMNSKLKNFFLPDHPTARKESLMDRNSCIVLYSINDRHSFEEVDFLIESFCKYKEIENPKRFPMILIGNKCDLEDKRVVSFEEGKERALNYGIRFMEISAKENINVDEMYHLMLEIFENFQQANELKRLLNSNPIKKEKPNCFLM